MFGVSMQLTCTRLHTQGFYLDWDALRSYNASLVRDDTCASATSTFPKPCVPCPKFSNTSLPNASSIWDCECVSHTTPLSERAHCKLSDMNCMFQMSECGREHYTFGHASV
jgi:hypothetical protein